MDVERWDGWLERTLLVLVGAALGFGILAFGGVRVREFLVVEGLVTLALLVWVIRIWLVRDHRLLWPPVAWGVVLFAAWAAWRTAEADLPYVAWSELLRILTYTALFFVVVNNLHRQNAAQGLAWYLAGLATLLCFYGAWQFASSSNTVWGLGRGEDYVHRASGAYANPNHFAGLLELLLPLIISLVIASRMKPVGRVLLVYTILVMLAGLVLTFSRGGWIAAGLGMVMVLGTLLQNRDYRWPAVAGLAVLLVAGGAAIARSSVMKDRIRESYDLDPQARNSRPNIWKAAIAMWREHPRYGVGPAHFSERFKQYRTHWAHGEPERAHNDYLNTLADWGVAGTAVALVPWVLLGYGVHRTLRQVRRDPGSLEVKRSGRYAFVLGASASLGALLIHGLVDFNFHIPGNALVAVAWMGLLAGYSRYATDDWWVSNRKPWRLPLSAVALALAGVLGYDLGLRGAEERHLLHARKSAPASDEQLAELTAAFQLRPLNAETAYAIGELHRLRAFTGMPGHEERARTALEWFDRAAKLNPYNPVLPTRAGMCLDWLGRHEEAGGRFAQALKLDPEGSVTSCYLGWHELQKGDEAAARRWFIRSTEQGWPPYEEAMNYLRLLERRDRERAGLPATPAPPNPVTLPATPGR